MPIQMNDVLDSDNSEMIVIERKNNGRYDSNNRWVDGCGHARIKALASIQPANAQVLESLPEGRRSSKAIVVICNKPLYTTSDDREQPDVVEYKGQRFEIVEITDWGSYGHYEAIGVLNAK